MNDLSDLALNALVQPVIITLVAGAITYLVSRQLTAACKYLSLLASAAVLTVGIVMVYTAPAPLHWVWADALVKDVKDLSFSVDLATSPLGLLVVIASAAFAFLIAIYSFRDTAGTPREGKFHAYLIWALGGTCLVGLAQNLLVLLVGWEIVTLMLFLLINLGRAEARKGAAKAYGVLGFADACLLLAVALLIAMPGGTKNLVFPKSPISVSDMGATGYAVYALILVAALAKAGAVPLHTWIPAIAKDAPTSVMAYLPAALDKLLGIYLLAVLSLRMFKPDGTMQVVMMIIGAVTILSAVLMAMMQHNLKRLLSFHAVSQVGYMVLGIGTGTAIGVIGGLFHMLNHAIYKCNLFLMSGSVGEAAGSDEIEDMGGLARVLPVTFVCGLVSAFAISGVPPFNGFASKWLIYQGALEVSNTHRALAVVLVVVAVFGSALTLASFVKVMYSAFLSAAPRGKERPAGRAKESVARAIPMVVLAVACVLFGIWPGLAVEGILVPGVKEMSPVIAASIDADIAAEGGAVRTGDLGFWSPAQATGLLLVGLALGLLFLWAATLGKRARIVRPFLGGEVPEPDDDRFRVPGTQFYRTIAELPVLGPWLAHGEQGAMDPYHWSARHGNTFVQLLRSVHTGLVSLYVAWCLLGLTAILVYLFVTSGT
jgi:formate hydrogenlyase subunit 3/multisubunit Na+/H+ antiporter MnhD subunit